QGERLPERGQPGDERGIERRIIAREHAGHVTLKQVRGESQVRRSIGMQQWIAEDVERANGEPDADGDGETTVPSSIAAERHEERTLGGTPLPGKGPECASPGEWSVSCSPRITCGGSVWRSCSSWSARPR